MIFRFLFISTIFLFSAHFAVSQDLPAGEKKEKGKKEKKDKKEEKTEVDTLQQKNVVEVQTDSLKKDTIKKPIFKKYPDIPKIAFGPAIGSPLFIGGKIIYQPTNLGLRIDVGSKTAKFDTLAEAPIRTFRVDMRYNKYPDKDLRVSQFIGFTGFERLKVFSFMFDLGIAFEYRHKHIGFIGETGLLYPLNDPIFKRNSFTLLGSVGLLYWL